MNLPVVKSLWIGGQLSTMERLSIKSFIKNGHPYELYTYDHVDDIPDETILKDANAILPESRIFRYPENGSYAGFANLFRYKLLLDHGGLWCDTDIICLRPIRLKFPFVTYQWKKNGKRNVNNCAIGCQSEERLMQRAFEEADNSDQAKLQWGQTGPELLTRLVRELDFRSIEHPRSFSPIRFFRIEKCVFEKDSLENYQDCYGIHLYNEMWRRKGLDKNATYRPDCLYEQLKALYL